MWLRWQEGTKDVFENHPDGWLLVRLADTWAIIIRSRSGLGDLHSPSKANGGTYGVD